jgi:hypothetical protein
MTSFRGPRNEDSELEEKPIPQTKLFGHPAVLVLDSYSRKSVLAQLWSLSGSISSSINRVFAIVLLTCKFYFCFLWEKHEMIYVYNQLYNATPLVPVGGSS